MTMNSNVDSKQNAFFSILKKCPIDRFQKLFHHFIDQFCGHQTSLYESFADVYSMLEWWSLIDQSRTFLKEYFTLDNKTSENTEPLPAEYNEIMKNVLDVRSSDLKNELLEKTHAVSPACLTSFDWKLKMTLASDKMSQINEPRLLLDLDISGTREKSLQLDLSKDELKRMIDAMEKAKRNVVDLMAD